MMGQISKEFRAKRLMTAVMSGIFAVSCSAGAEDIQSETQPAVEQTLSAYDQVAPEITQWMTEPAILVFSKTKAWRHNEGIAGADRFFADVAAEEGFGFFTTENGAVFNAENLARFDVIIFNNIVT